jgi:hypothetical protein
MVSCPKLSFQLKIAFSLASYSLKRWQILISKMAGKAKS